MDVLAVAGPHEELLIGRDAHKSVVSGLVLAGIRPVWVEPCWDPELHLAHPPSPEAFAAAFRAHPQATGAGDLADAVRHADRPVGLGRGLP
jgi:arginine decarboxylase